MKSIFILISLLTIGGILPSKVQAVGNLTSAASPLEIASNELHKASNLRRVDPQAAKKCENRSASLCVNYHGVDAYITYAKKLASAKRKEEKGRLNQWAQEKRLIVNPAPVCMGNLAALARNKDVWSHLLSNYLDIRSVARLEQTSKSMRDVIRTRIIYTNQKSDVDLGYKKEVTWEDMKKWQIPHMDGISVRRRYLGRKYFVEAMIAISEWNEEDEKVSNEKLRENLDRAISFRDSEACEAKLRYLRDGSYGYSWSSEEARTLNEEFVALGHRRAINRKIVGLGDGWYGYSKNHDEARKLNEELVALGHRWAIERKIEGLDGSWHCYPKRPDEARKLNEQFVALGHRWAIEKKVSGFDDGKYGYPRSSEKVKKLTDEFVALGQRWAIERKIDSLYFRDGIMRKPMKAKALIEKHVAAGEIWAIEKKIQGLDSGWYGYSKSPDEAKALIEKHVPAGESWALHKKIYGLRYGLYGYKKNDESREKLKELIEWLVVLGDKEAIENKLCSLVYKISDPVYEVNIEEAVRLSRFYMCPISKYRHF